MPAEPLEYRIVLNVQAALLAITINAGYHHDVAGLAVKLDPNQGVEALVDPEGPRPFIVLEPRPERWDYSDEQAESAPGLHELLILTLPVTVHWINTADPTVDESRLRTFFRGCADIEQALGVDMTRGGLAVDTRVTRRTYDQAFDSAQVWAMVETEIRMVRTLGLPNG